MLKEGLFLVGVGIGAIAWGALGWSGRYRGWTDNPVTRTTIFAGMPFGTGLVLLGIFELFSIRGRFLGYLIDGCFILAFLFLLITPEPLGPTWYRKLYQKKRRKHQATERPE